jgi:enoyl-CoA hydratase/carnithine racemase
MALALSLADLANLAAAPAELPPASPLGRRKFLVVDVSGPLPEGVDLAGWLQRQPCPVLGIGREGPILDACDAMVGEAAALAPLIATIEAAPIAATVLVQLLRATEKAAIEDGLVAESLAYATLQAGPEFVRWQATRQRRDPPHPDPLPPKGRRGSFLVSPSPPLLLTRTDAHLDIRLNRPSHRNAISVELRDALVEAFQLVAADPSITDARVTGAGRCFSIGGDLDEFGTVPDPATGHIIRSLRLPARALLECGDRVSFHLHGACLGAGIELPAFAKRVTAAPDAFFQLPELRFGLIPGAGGCISLPRRIGRRRTAWLALSGRRITARQALAWGLIDAILPSV